MTAPEFIQHAYDYTEFDGKPMEWWQGYRRRHKLIPQEFSETDKLAVAAVVPDTGLQQHVARIARSSQEGHTTLLTTSGHVIQFQAPQKAQAGAEATPGAIYGSKDIDAKGVAIVMAHYERKGFDFTADQIPFGKDAPAEFKTNVRKLWAEVQAAKAPKPATTEPRQIVARQLAPT